MKQKQPKSVVPFKVCICTPCTGFMRGVTTYSLVRLALYFAQVPVFEGRPQIMDVQEMEGPAIGGNREAMIDICLKDGFTHVLFVDEDMAFYPDILHILARRNKPVVACNYPMRNPNAGFTARDLENTPIETLSASEGLQEVLYAGLGLCLIDLSVFSKMQKPWFLPYYIGGHYTTEDVPFFEALRKNEICKAYIDHDASKRTLHIGNYAYKWQDYEPESAT